LLLLELALYGFRNLKEQSLSFGEGLQVFLGSNAQGKTNLLEAIYTLTVGRSFRAVDDSILLQEGAPGFKLTGRIGRKSGELKITLKYDAEKRVKTAEANSQPLRRIVDLWGEVKAVVFSPLDMQLVKGPPMARRQFINRFLGQASGSYRHNLLRFSYALKQRNAILKRLLSGEKGEGLEVWEEAFINFGQAVIEERMRKIKRVGEVANDVYLKIGASPKKLTIKYKPASADLASDIRVNRPREIMQGTSLFGPHLDELEIFLDGKDARAFSSEGEARSLALALRMAEWRFVKEESGEEPLMILDDALSELDEKRQVALLSLLKEYPQVFLSTVSKRFLPDPFFSEAEFYHVQAGEARKSPKADI